LALVIDPLIPGVPLGLFLIAVTSAAWYGGLGPGLLATLLSILMIDYYLESPFGSFVISSTATMLELVLFVTGAVAISTLSGTLRRARARAELAVAAARAGEVRTHILAESGRILGASLDYEATLKSLAFLVVPTLADRCTIDVRNARGEFVRAAAAQTDFPSRPGMLAVDPEQRDVPGHGNQTLRIPLRGQQGVLGELTLARNSSAFASTEVVLAEELGRRAAAAMDNARLYRAAEEARAIRERAADRMSRLNAMAAILAEGITLDQTASLLLAQAVSVVGAAGGRVHHFDTQRRRLVPLAATGAPGPARLALEMVEQPGACLDEVQFFDNTMLLPLVLRGRPVGMLELVVGADRDLADDDLSLLSALTRQGAQALERARLYDAERRARAAAESAMESLRAVQVVTDAALAHLDLDDLLRELLTRVRDVLAVDLAAVLILSESGDALIERASVGVLANSSRGARVPVGDGVSGQIALSRAPLIVEDLRTARVMSPVLRAAGVRSFLGVPLIAEGRLIGVVHVDSIEPRQFTSEDTHLMQLVADRLALAINQARLYEGERFARAEAERLATERAAVLAQIGDGVVIAGQDGAVTFVNEAARSFFGASMPAGAIAALQRAAQDGDSVTLELDGDQDQARIAVGRAVPVTADDGSTMGAVLTLRDVTDERVLEQRKDEFFSGMSHDLRTPVATIKGAVEVVLENEPPGVPGALHRMLQIINDEADRMSTLVDDLLELTRAQAGHLQLQFESTDLGSLVERVARSIEPLAAARAQRVLRDVPAEPVEAAVDAGRLERALQNLIANAQKYGRDGGAIDVRLTCDAATAQITVADDGPGIPEADQRRIFERFYRSSDIATRRIQGSGLGLPIARAVVELHGGRLDVVSTPGRGATFTMSVPRFRPNDEAPS
jgi:K+-sensing histidine kinase KdpD